RSLYDSLRQRRSLEKLHHEVVDFAFPPHVVESTDMRMRELRDRFCLSLESVAAFGRSGQVLGKDLDRDRAIQPRVARLVHLSHPARPGGRTDLVGSEARTAGKTHEIRRASRGVCLGDAGTPLF